MDVKKLIKTLGGQTKVAELMSIKKPSVNAWVSKNHIPELSRIYLAVKAEDMGIAKRQDFFPNDAGTIWPDLR